MHKYMGFVSAGLYSQHKLPINKNDYWHAEKREDMKIEANSANTTVTPADGGYHRSHRPDKTEQKKQLQGNTIQASLLHIKPEKASKEAIMEQANRKALKTLLSQFADDESTSQTMKDLSDRSMKNQADAVEYLNKAREQAAKEEAVKNQYDVDPDSEEQRNLDLLIKQADGEKLTDEETAILENMGPLTEYQEDYLYAHKEKLQYIETAVPRYTLYGLGYVGVGGKGCG